MATIHHMDGFDFYAAAQLNLFWTGSNAPLLGAYGRNGTPGIHCGNSVNGVWKDIATGFATHYCGVSVKLRTAGIRLPIFCFSDTATAGVNGVQFMVLINASASKIEVWRGHPNVGALLATGTTVFTIDTERYVTAKLVVSDTVGEILVTINGVTEINLTVQDTKFTANAWADRLGLGNEVGYTGDGFIDFDDFWWNDYEAWGDVRVEGRLPNGNGNLSNFLGSDGNSVDNYLLVDENPPNGDTDYVSSGTAGDIDLYAMQNATPTSGTVKAVGVHLYARKDDAGARSIAPMVRDGTTNNAGTTQAIGTSYLYYSQYYKDNPVTTNPWTITEVNADEFGVKEVA